MLDCLCRCWCLFKLAWILMRISKLTLPMPFASGNNLDYDFQELRWYVFLCHLAHFTAVLWIFVSLPGLTRIFMQKSWQIKTNLFVFMPFPPSWFFAWSYFVQFLHHFEIFSGRDDRYRSTSSPAIIRIDGNISSFVYHTDCILIQKST